MVEGELLEHVAADVPASFVADLVALYVRMLREGYLHQDPHPANIYYIRSMGAYVLIDWGEVVEVPEAHRADAILLLKWIVAGRWMGSADDSLAALFDRLGVVVKPGRTVDDSNYQGLANLLNIVQALRGDSEESNATLIKATDFQAPGWFEAWQKGTNALAIALKAVDAKTAA